MAGPRLEGKIGADASEFIKASNKSRDALGRFVKKGDEASGSLGKLGAVGSKVSNVMGKVAGGIAIVAKGLLQVAKVGAVAGVALSVVAAKSIGLAREQIRVQNQLAAAIKSTGGAAGLTAEELSKHAAALQQVTNFGDEATIQAQAMLLTFTKIGRNIFPETTEAVQNVATAMRVSLKDAAVQVGKALNDPIVGMTALSRSGITSTQSQKDMIKTLVKTGKTLDAQKIILKELETQFGGSARAAADPLIQLGNTIGDVGEEIGKALLPAANAFARIAGSAFKTVGAEVKALAKVFGGRIKAMSKFIENLGSDVDTSKGIISTSLDAISDAWKTVGDFVASSSEDIADALTVLEFSFNILKAGVQALTLRALQLTKVFLDFAGSDFAGVLRKVFITPIQIFLDVLRLLPGGIGKMAASASRMLIPMLL